MRILRYLLVGWVVLAAGSKDGASQTKKYSFQQLTEEQGLAQNFVYGVVQDDRGFLWVGTGSGLSRYDGDEIKNFHSDRDSLSGEFITADCRTASGNLVFGHNQGGVTIFDGIGFNPIIPDTLGNKIVGIAEDHTQSLWVATQSRGLIFVGSRRITIASVFPDELQGQFINAIAVQRDVLWIGTNEALLRFRIKGRELTFMKGDILPSYLGAHAIMPDMEDSLRCWIGTAYDGIYLVKSDTRTGSAAVEATFRSSEFANDIVQSLAQDRDGDLWVGTRQGGAVYVNLGRDGKSIFKRVVFNKTTGYPLTSVTKLVVDRLGQVWIGTSGSGLVKIFREAFIYFPFASQYGVAEVRSIAEAPNRYLVGTDKGLLEIRLNPNSGEYHVEAADDLKNESILSLYTDSRGNTWVGTEYRGVYLFPRGGHPIRRIMVDPDHAPVEVRLFEEDTRGNLWLSARGQGVYVLDKDHKLTNHYTTANRFIHNDIFAIKADSKGNIWFGTYGAGLAMLDTIGALHLFSKQETLRARDINDIAEDGAGNIWIATEGDGFFKYAGQHFTQVGSIDNLVSPFIKGIQFDPTGRIWFSYRKGLGYLDLQSEKKYHFSSRDGLLANEAYSSSIIVDSKANKWFCNDYGVTLFAHDTIANTRKPLETYLTGLRIFFKDYPGFHRTSDELTTSMVGKLPAVQLAHTENHLTFDFVAIKLHGLGKIYYRHFLEGFDEEWTPAKTENSVTYTNLDPGKYVFKVQASDDLSVWVDPVMSYSFTIVPPYWKRTWFYLLQIVSVVGLFTLTYFMGIKRVSTKRYVLRLMLFSSFFITLEYVENFVDPLVSDFFGGAPVFRFFLNFILALLLLPVESIITHTLMNKDERTGAVVDDSEADTVEHTQAMADEESQG